MSLCGSLQKLHRAEGSGRLLFQAFHKAALGCQQQDTGSLRSERARHRRPFALPGTSWHRITDKAELSTLPGASGHGTDDKAELLAIKDGARARARSSKLPGKAGPGTLAKSLVKKVMALSDVKEEVYGALDEWAAFELEFPLMATRNALKRLRQGEQWHRIIQVTKWMFSKGVGKTHGSYSLLLKAYCMDGRLQEAGELWDKLLASYSRSTPKNMFCFMTNVYRRREMSEKVAEVFEQMESFGIKPDKDLLRRAEEAYQQLNMQEKVELLGRKYALDSKTRRKEKRLMARKALKHSKLEERVSQIEEDCKRECQTNKDEDNVDENVTMVKGQEMQASFSIEQRVVRTERGCNSDYQTNDVEESPTTIQGKKAEYRTNDVEKSPTTIQGKKARASSRTDGISNLSENLRNFKKADTSSPTDEIFVEQVIASMPLSK